MIDPVSTKATPEQMRDEIIRLRHIIFSEGRKWQMHHTDPDKIKYWEDFENKARRYA